MKRKDEHAMKIISVNVAKAPAVQWRGRTVTTGIFKTPVAHAVAIEPGHVEGDLVADLRYHGGRDKAVYAYASEHYAFWTRQFKDRELPWGMFGENLTVEGGLFEESVFVGDRFALGTAELVAVQPRMPCYKLGIRFGTQRFVKEFAKSEKFGIYFRVAKSGTLQAGDAVTKLAGAADSVSVRDIGRIILGEADDDPALIVRAARLEALPEVLRARFEAMLEGRGR